MTDDEVTTDGSGGYGASNTIIPEGLETIRKRPGMYIGPTDERGLYHLVYEVVDDPIDKVLTGCADRTEVTILEDDDLQIVDNGRGISIDEHPNEHRLTVEAITMIPHTGGKFDGGGYAVSGSLHSTGISVVNALPARVDTVIRRQGYVWHMPFMNGGHSIIELVCGEVTEETGTAQTFYPNPEIFGTIIFSFGTLRQRFQQMALPNKDPRITLTDERPTTVDDSDEITGDELGTADDPVPGHRVVSYMYEHGLHDYVKYTDLTEKDDVTNVKITDFKSENDKGTIGAKVTMQWTIVYSSSVHTFVNTVNAIEGGTHEERLRTTLTIFANRYGRKRNIIEDKDGNFTGDDIYEGLIVVTSIKLSKPRFEGQMKTKLGNTEACIFVQQQVYLQLGGWFDTHPAEAKAVTQKSQRAQIARVATRKVREATRRKGALGSVSIPGKLCDYSSRKVEGCEIFIVEGDSTEGPTVGGCDPEHQTTIPIRGEILNVKKTRPDRALSSDTIRFLITASGMGIGKDFNFNKLRYNKIVTMADMDADGQHIATLLLTLLFRYMRPLIEQGHTYIVMSSPYRIKWMDVEHELAYSDKERDKLLTAGQSAGYRPPKEGDIQRHKDLGETNDHELWETTMDPAHRILKQVTPDETADTGKILVILIGDDVDRRRPFTQHNVSDVRLLDTWH